ncbi:MAG: hypothetical protein WD027_08030 [Gaiellales bacterium]
MTARLVVIAVAALAAIAAADTVRGWGPASERERPADPLLAEALHDAGGFVAAGKPRTRVLHRGRLYLTAEQIADAFPPPLEGVLFDIGHVASAPDGTVALAIYNFGTAEPPRNVIQFWREGRLVGAFPVSPGTFGGGIGFTQDGRFGARAPRGNRTTLFPTG